MKTLKLNAKKWSCPHKQEARSKTLLEPYQTLFGRSLPKSQQYWTLCGEMASSGAILEGCELSQMVGSGLISPNQFHGVEGNPQIYQANVDALQKPLDTAKLYQGEFTTVLDKALTEGNLNPGIVYLDTIQEPKGSSALLATTMDTLNQTSGNTLLVWNFIKGNRHRGRDYPYMEIERLLQKSALFRKASQKWSQYGSDKVYQYAGTGTSATTMCSVVFYRTN